MLVRVIFAAALALGLSAGAAEARQCRPVHQVVHRPACAPCHRVSYRRHRRMRVIERTVHLYKPETIDRRAYEFAEMDQHWGGASVWGPVRPSPPHPWDTDPNGLLTWPGKPPADAVVEDRYSGQPRRLDPRNDGCPDNCPLSPPGPVSP